MQVKRFIGSDMVQLMDAIKKEFGDDALILNTSKKKVGGFLGFFKKEVIEILVASYDKEAKAINPSVTKKTNNNINSYPKSYQREYMTNDNKLNTIDNKDFKQSLNTNMKRQTYTSTGNYMSNSLEKSNIKLTKKEEVDDYIDKREKVATQTREEELKRELLTPKQQTAPDPQLKAELDEIKNTVFQLSKKINETFKTTKEEEEEKRFNNEIEKMMRKGMSKELSTEILTSALRRDKEFTHDSLYNAFIDRFQPLKADYDENPKYSIFVGSTGVGKTTTLAKLASTKAIETNAKIGFLTLDTYRISAVEQLKTYAEILSSPIEVAYETQDVKHALDRLSNRNYIFIDTAGRSHNNRAQMLDLRRVVEEIKEKKVYLVLSANTNIFDLEDIIKSYSFIENFSIIVTKLDETNRLGILFDIMDKTKKQISYTTHGQKVPDDFEKFQLNKFINEFLRES